MLFDHKVGSALIELIHQITNSALFEIARASAAAPGDVFPSVAKTKYVIVRNDRHNFLE